MTTKETRRDEQASATDRLILQWRKEAQDGLKHDRYYRMALGRCANDLERATAKAAGTGRG